MYYLYVFDNKTLIQNSNIEVCNSEQSNEPVINSLTVLIFSRDRPLFKVILHHLLVYNFRYIDNNFRLTSLS